MKTVPDTGPQFIIYWAGPHLYTTTCDVTEDGKWVFNPREVWTEKRIGVLAFWPEELNAAAEQSVRVRWFW